VTDLAIPRLLAGLSSISTRVRSEEGAHHAAVAKARKLGQDEPGADLPRASSPKWVRTAAKLLRESEAEPWYSHRDVADDWDPIGLTLAQLREAPEFVTILNELIDVRWSIGATVQRDLAHERVVMGRVAVVPREERATWPTDEEPPAFRFRLSVPAFALATSDEIERALHELLAQCGVGDNGPVKRRPDIVGHSSTLARYGAVDVQEAQAVACAMAHPETRRAMTRYGFDPVSGQGILWPARSPRQPSLGDA
jgi:hypothetical protein